MRELAIVCDVSTRSTRQCVTQHRPEKLQPAISRHVKYAPLRSALVGDVFCFGITRPIGQRARGVSRHIALFAALTVLTRPLGESFSVPGHAPCLHSTER
jgi:hypothetical protein